MNRRRIQASTLSGVNDFTERGYLNRPLSYMVGAGVQLVRKSEL